MNHFWIYFLGFVLGLFVAHNMDQSQVDFSEEQSVEIPHIYHEASLNIAHRRYQCWNHCACLLNLVVKIPCGEDNPALFVVVRIN